MNDHAYCVTCYFWSGDRKEVQSVGVCHRYPPQIAGLVKQQIQSAGAHWCGEYVRNADSTYNNPGGAAGTPCTNQPTKE